MVCSATELRNFAHEKNEGGKLNVLTVAKDVSFDTGGVLFNALSLPLFFDVSAFGIDCLDRDLLDALSLL